MTRSELFCVMTVGLATVAGSVLIGYSLVGVPLNYLLAASFMTFPAGILMAKIMVPETEQFDETNEQADIADTESVNVIDAAARGAAAGLNLALIVGALLIAFISLIALLNTILGFFGGLFGFPDLTFELLLGYVFAPIAFVIGVPWSESVVAGTLSAKRLYLMSSWPSPTSARGSGSSPTRRWPSSPSRSAASRTSARWRSCSAGLPRSRLVAGPTSRSSASAPFSPAP